MLWEAESQLQVRGTMGLNDYVVYSVSKETFDPATKEYNNDIESAEVDCMRRERSATNNRCFGRLTTW